jgi:APA family basic amino acid/polyamine antiporter
VSDPAPTRLSRRLGVGDAVVIGLGSMLGAGVFAALGPAAAAAGSGLLVGLVVAGAVAYCNATSSASLAALYPESGGTYVYGRERLGLGWGRLAGWVFVVGKTASGAAMALTFGAYALPSAARAVGAAVVVAVTAVNLLGVRKTALVTRVVVAVVLGVLAFVVVAGLGGGTASADRLSATGWSGVLGVLEAAGYLFFAFAGYARVATLGEEVVDPARTIPRAVTVALTLVLVVYGLVAVVALLAVGPEVLASSSAPLASVVAAGSLSSFVWVVRVGGAVASVGVLLSLLAGISRTTFAMASNGDLPRWLSAVHAERRVPHRAEIVVGVAVLAVVLFADLRGAVALSSVAVLTYYGIANAAAWTLEPSERRWPRWLAAAGVVGCAVVALSLVIRWW